ncbi:MAG: CsgG/HfaB family protein [Candidatus Zixiibacteriota bacterium]
MKKCKVSLIAGIFSLLILSFSMVGTVSAQVEFNLADKITEALNYYIEAEFEKSTEIVDKLIVRNDLSAKDSVAIYEVMSIISYAKGQEYRRKSFDYLDKISDIGPCVINFPRDLWPSELRDRWYKIAQAKNMLVCPEEKSHEIKTIAIMEFDNHSIGKFQEELGSLSKGLADFFEYDFSQASGLKVVERDKIDFVLKELELQASGKVDESTAAQVGKILGAQLMVFGSITQLNNKETRMIVRVVKVETSEIIASVSKEGKPDYIMMEKELVSELAEKLNLMISDDAKEKIKAAGPENMDAAKLYASGLDFMDKYDYEKAYEYFKMAYEKDNTFAEAKRKMEIYKPLIG